MAADAGSRPVGRERFLEPALAAGLILVDAVLLAATDLTPIGFGAGTLGCIAAGLAGYALRTSIVGVCMALLGYLVLAPTVVGGAEYACLIPVASAFAQARRRLALIAAASFLVLGTLLHGMRWGFEPGELALFAVIWAFFLSVAATAGEALLRTRVLAQHRELEVSRAHQREIATELHDTVAHQLARIALSADRAAEVGPNPEDLTAIAQTARDAARDLRRIMEVLEVDRTAVTGTLGLTETLDATERRLRGSGFKVASTVEGDLSSVEPSLRVGLNRILVECTNNVERHGAEGCPVARVVTVSDDAVEVLLSNTRKANGKSHPGRGLRGIQQRVMHLGGTLEILTEHNQWTIHLALPRLEKRVEFASETPR